MNPFTVSLTFDDGWKSAFERAYPLLQKYAIPATFFIISERVDKAHTEYMDIQDLSVLTGAGHEIGSHTRSHKHLPELSDKDIWNEIAGGMSDLQALGFSPRTFAYPFGEWNPYVVKQVREVGFFGARSIEQGVNNSKTNHLLLRGYAVREEHTADDVASWITVAQKTGGWLVLYLHQIEPASVLREREWIYGSTPEVLEQVLSFLRRENIETLTFEKGLERLVVDTLAR